MTDKSTQQSTHHIHVRNMSKHPQRFEVHGWNNDKNIVVKPHHTAKIAALDGSSGAIIAVHEGHEGEQAEITKAGFGGNDFIDLSNIVGAGGNLIVQQVGAPGTRKGDPLFMQHLNKAWSKASEETKDKLKGSVTVKRGKVIRISPIKDNPDLENFVRTFADGKTYIGVGSWGGSPGKDSDNKQSSAAQGSKDILVCYNDGDARPRKEKKDGNNGREKHAEKKDEADSHKEKTKNTIVDEVDSDDQSENESVAGDSGIKAADTDSKPAKGPNFDSSDNSNWQTNVKDDDKDLANGDESQTEDEDDDGEDRGDGNGNKPELSIEEQRHIARVHQGGPPPKTDAEVDKEDEEADKKRTKDEVAEKDRDLKPNFDHPLFKGLKCNSSRKQYDSENEKVQDSKGQNDNENESQKHHKSHHGPGITLANRSNKPEDYYFYNNLWNGNGTAGANFDHPMKSVHLKPDDKKFVKLPTSFKGRVQRGKELPCTWVEFQVEASDDHGSHGDISLEQGCDGAAKILSTDGSDAQNGFDFDIIKNAPQAAIRRKPNGEKAIDTTMGNWMTGPNHAAIHYLNKVVGQNRAYITGGTGVPDVASKNKRLLVEMY
ncbi:hypothetical protein TWF694_001150 [Orbilia ellipsospora]|uniref:Uncharacterized protein n=1 Tax=Orbilia ellipsospora TaxID=2528407 RepID=A0AAV9XRK5_9PEZI